MNNFTPKTRNEEIDDIKHLTSVSKGLFNDKPSWKSIKLAELYIKYVNNNVILRLHNHVIKAQEDEELLPYIKKDNSGIIVFNLGIPVSPTENDTEILMLSRYRNGGIYLGLHSNIYYIKYILIKRNARDLLDKFIYPELKKATMTPDELIAATTGFVYTLEERFSKNSPLPKEITLKAKSGKSILMHNHVAGSVSKVLYKAIYGPFIGDKIINLQCLDQTLEWFAESAYTGVFKFDETLTDHIDGANLLDYLEVLTKENLYQLLHAELFD
ncbi:hypothetical protein D5b_00271 [Faustovirus]|nr:hypothetical protein D5b_00271 [Faustovirus]AMN84642.1 hypothetical protein D6_00239 [Faustovirus]AMP44224.1 hypothetical protein PRJ_Dakar_00268 [Faustovirus]